MSVREILDQVETLSTEEQNQVAAFLVHLRHKKDPSYYQKVHNRLERSDDKSWKSLEDIDVNQ